MLKAVALATLLAFAGTAQEKPDTLRSFLRNSHFEAPLSALPAAELDRPLTSSAFGFDNTQFVAALYFADEARAGALGALHLLRISKPGGGVRRLQLDEPQGSVTSVNLGQGISLIATHWNPSAGGILVLDSSLVLIATLKGFSPEFAPGGVLFTGNMIHFAPNHQSTLFRFEARTKTTTEVFPGANESPLAVGFRSSIRDAVQRLPASFLEFYKSVVYGPPNDFNRSILASRSDGSGNHVALIVSYDSGMVVRDEPDFVVAGGDLRMRRDPSWRILDFETVVLCERATIETWSCRERLLDAALAEFKLARPGDEWQQRQSAYASVLEQTLKRR